MSKPQRWFADGLLGWLDAHPTVSTPIDYADHLIRAATERRELRDDVARFTPRHRCSLRVRAEHLLSRTT